MPTPNYMLKSLNCVTYILCNSVTSENKKESSRNSVRVKTFCTSNNIRDIFRLLTHFVAECCKRECTSNDDDDELMLNVLRCHLTY